MSKRKKLILATVAIFMACLGVFIKEAFAFPPSCEYYSYICSQACFGYIDLTDCESNGYWIECNAQCLQVGSNCYEACPSYSGCGDFGWVNKCYLF